MLSGIIRMILDGCVVRSCIVLAMGTSGIGYGVGPICRDTYGSLALGGVHEYGSQWGDP